MIEPVTTSSGAGWLLADYTTVVCLYMDDTMTDEGFASYLAAMLGSVDRRIAGRKVAAFYYAPNSNLNAERRGRVASALDERKQHLADTTAAVALATESMFVRGILTAVNWLAPPGYPCRAFATPEQALSFIAKYLPEADTVEIGASFMQLCRLNRPPTTADHTGGRAAGSA